MLKKKKKQNLIFKCPYDGWMMDRQMDGWTDRQAA